MNEKIKISYTVNKEYTRDGDLEDVVIWVMFDFGENKDEHKLLTFSPCLAITDKEINEFVDSIAQAYITGLYYGADEALIDAKKSFDNLYFAPDNRIDPVDSFERCSE